MGVRLRTTLTATAAVAAALCLASMALFAALESSLTGSTRRLALLDAEKQAVQVRCAQPPAARGASSSAACGKGALARPSSPAVRSTAAVPARGRASAALKVAEVVNTRRGPVTVTGTASREPARAALDTLKKLLIPGVPALLALVALATWLAVGRVLRPVSAIRAKVADITAHGLHEQVPVPDTRDEIAALARTVNTTLDRLRNTVEAHRKFVADAAHELRSPMAVLHTRLDLAGPAEKRLAADALDDVERLQALSADLLLLARLDAGEPLRTEEVDLGQLVAEEAARHRCPRTGTGTGVSLDLASDVLVQGSAERLRRLVSNLVDNAVRHASQAVDVTLFAEHGMAVIDVADDGPGIPPEHRSTVFDRFTRLDHARARDTGGSGLGLSIARDVAQAHGGTLRVLPSERGARLRATLPAPGRHSGQSPKSMALSAR